MHRHPFRVPAFALFTGALFLASAAPPAGAQTSTSKNPPQIAQPSPTQPAQGPPSGPAYQGRFLVGDEAPDIDLHDQSDRRFHLTDARKQKPWLIVFARTPEDVAEVERAWSDVAALGVGMVAIAPFHRDRVTPLVPNPQVPLLTDGASRIARVYGAFDPVSSNPRSAVFLVSRSGKILWFISGGLPAPEEITRLTRESLERSGQLPPEAPAKLN